jgi:hypothetical protein
MNQQPEEKTTLFANKLSISWFLIYRFFRFCSLQGRTLIEFCSLIADSRIRLRHYRRSTAQISAAAANRTSSIKLTRSLQILNLRCFPFLNLVHGP